MNIGDIMINVININKEEISSDATYFYIGRPSILSNPYTHLDKDKTLALYQCEDREESIDKYDEYFDIMYGHNKEFTDAVDEIYEHYKNGETVYLGCFCKPLSCHGDIIKRKLEQRLIKEKIQLIKNDRTNKT